MTSKLFYRTRGKIVEREMGKLLTGTFSPKPRVHDAVYRGNGRILVEGEEYDLQSVPAALSPGDLLTVQNIGRRASTSFVPVTGGRT